ncbi:tryptophan synthase subunit alpha [Pelotomaculum isophthalicicum JI]|uniref:Tryptophan synthase alpha chain n=1 Tax=Pelotomaculum isophthalicicum JI TaxID=947010 RepID=A0A9X4H166_9FIRM|nr:tryptophan synthase subunit alpha [Pelotomaculum isophthalicicum]MDF9407381.1 tryptophan synthase subunit alpha [Pelotomaculum isophthalicicum JI]
MNSNSIIEVCLDKLRLEGKKGLITFITAGDPDLSSTVDLALRMDAAGADIIELGVPFSDPLADGPVIQQASSRALAAGTTLAKILDTVKKIKSNCRAPLVLMGYCNPFYRFGLDRFIAEAASAGVSGLIVPDLPLEESGPLMELAIKEGLDLIPLVSPVTTDRRLSRIASKAMGFVYCVSVTGVTGARKEIGTDIESFTGRVRSHTSLPLAIGFGIADPEQGARMSRYCDAVVVGSAIVKLIADSGSSQAAGTAVENLTREFKTALLDSAS